MRIVLAPNSFKGSANAIDVARWLATGIKAADPTIEAIEAPIADRGDGSLEILRAAGFTPRSIRTTDTLGEEIEARIGIRGDTAFIETALISGLKPLREKKLEPLRASTYGLGVAIGEVLDLGCKRIILGLGGSATTDGGAGALSALGAHLLDKSGNELPLGGGHLAELVRIQTDELDPRINETQFIALSDVTNPLLGDLGSAKVFAPQKGANQRAVEILERGLTNLVKVTKSKRAAASGAGADGGLGFMALEFLGGTLIDGTSWLNHETNFESKMEGADLIITGEGRYDAQSATTKATANLARLAASRGIPIALVCGEIMIPPAGFVASYQLVDQGDRDEVIHNPAPYLEALGAKIARERARFTTK